MKVGFLDFQLTNSHFKKFHSLLTGEVGGGEVTIVAADELEPTEDGKKWCKEKNVRYCETPQEVVEASDAILVLAPNNMEKHLEVAAPALTSGKPVFIDKMLAHTPDHAEQIVAVAKKSGTPIMSSSALRFAAELDELDKKLKGEPEEIFACGYGKFAIYGVHTLALALRYFGGKVRRVIDTGWPGTHLITLDGGERRAFMELRDASNARTAIPWQVGILSGGRYEIATVTDSNAFYENLMRKTLHFFRTGESAISVDEQLAMVRVLHAAEQSLAADGKWVELKDSAGAQG